MKTAMVAAIGILAIVLAGVALYGIFSLNGTMQAKPNPVQVSNYSAEIGSLQPQINSISNNVSSLNGLKSDISDIKGKLSDLETKINQSEQKTILITNPTIAIARSIYLQGDIVHVTAAGLDPQKVVQVELVDNNGYVVTQDQATTNLVGDLSYDFVLPSPLVPGNFQVKLVSGSVTISQPIKITAYTGSGSPYVILDGLSYLFTAQTDRTIYQAGDMVEIFGISTPNTTVGAVFTSPSGSTQTSNTTVQPDGTYAIFFSTIASSETGSWHITVSNQGLTRIVYLTLVPQGGTSNTLTFSARTDKNTYQAGEAIWVSGTALPNAQVTSILTSPSGRTYETSTVAGSDGFYVLSYATAPYYELGYWYVTLTSNSQTRQVPVYLESSGSGSYSSFTFTAQTEKSIYTKGETIQVTGIGLPYTTVKADFSSPSHTTYHAVVSSGSDGSYLLSFPTSSSYESGNWIISITNWQQTKTISIYLQP